MPDAVIFDVDGTLADVSGVRHYVMDDPKRKNFDAFHKAACYFAPANQFVIEAMNESHALGQTNFVVTARKERWRYYTGVWLRKWEAPADYLEMRRDDDARKDIEVKRDILARIRAAGFRVVHAWDDNPNVIKLWHEEGIPTTVVPGWVD
jgi:FMN phosphatase YigB (HAD superfamily)